MRSRTGPAIVVAVGLATLLLPGASWAARRFGGRLRLGAPLVAPVHDGVLRQSRAARRKLRSLSGGVYQTAQGEAVHVEVSDHFVADPQADQALVDFLGSLKHGSEISSVVVAVAAADELAEICGPDADACYDSSQDTLVVPGEELADGVSIPDVIAHEYGHAIADHRANPLPLPTIDVGTTQWAGYEDVCSRTYVQHTAFPGDEDTQYKLDPGEAFADSYRIANGGDPGVWQFDDSFFPDATDLADIAYDVAHDYAPQAATDFSGRFLRGASRRKTIWLNASHDGPVFVSGRTSGKLRATYELTDASGATVRTMAGQGDGFICGEDGRLALTITRRSKAVGRYRLSVRLP